MKIDEGYANRIRYRGKINLTKKEKQELRSCLIKLLYKLDLDIVDSKTLKKLLE